MNKPIEASYPITFRQEDAKELGKYLKNRSSVVLVGMKRVGISNFLRFFLNHEGIPEAYIADDKTHLFIPVNLNDLVEREIFPFWILTFKRIVDVVGHSVLDEHAKKYIEGLFLDSVQAKDHFLTLDAIRKSLVKIVESGFLPTLFFIRFDRIKDAITPAFFANLQSLRDAVHQELMYVFTGFRSLDCLSPSVFTKTSLSVFSKNIYIKPAKKEDIKIIFETYKDNYKLTVSSSLEQNIFNLVDGYVQYLQLALIIFSESRNEIRDKETLFTHLTNDERVSLQSEELWESLNEEEQRVILRISKSQQLTDADKEKGRYLWDTGFVQKINEGKDSIFSPLFEDYLQKREIKKLTESNTEFTKKENMLFNFLQKNLNEICEREQIIEVVWPEVEALGVSDWAIDRLVARVRNKLKKQKSPFEIVTVRTRGYKLVSV